MVRTLMISTADFAMKDVPPALETNHSDLTFRYLTTFFVALFFVRQALPATNVLFIAIDDLAPVLGCMGGVQARTPHMDRLAATGVCFTRAYNQLPLCNPTRASVMTGLRPDRIRVYDLDRHFRDELPDVITLPQHFKNSGWRTARVGKIFHYNVPAAIGTDGFDDPPSWELTVNPKGRDKTEENLVFNAEPHRKISASLSWLAAAGQDEEQTDGMIATEAIRLMKSFGKQPFFLGVGFFRPHTPYIAPARYFELYPLESIRLPYAPKDDREDIPTAAFAHNNPVPNYNLEEWTCRKALQAYLACVSFIDAQVGRLLLALEELGLDENTLVVLWSDHGYHLGEHLGIWQKRTLFEQSARSPLIIRSPGQPGNGQRCDRVVEFVDILPTVLEATGLPKASQGDGRSLVPLLQDPLAPWREEAITQVLRPADDRLSQAVMGRSLRTARWRYTDWAGGEQGVELYDHASDPMEFHNLARDPSPEIQRLMGSFKSRLDKKASPEIPSTPFNPARL